MPNLGSLANYHVTQKFNLKKARWKLCAQESHWNVQNVNSVTTI